MVENQIVKIMESMTKIKENINLLKIANLSKKTLIKILDDNKLNYYSRKKLQETYINNLIKKSNTLKEKLCMIEDINLIEKYNICICDYHLESLCYDGKLELVKFYVEKFNIEIDTNHIEFSLLGKQYDILVYLLNKLDKNTNLKNLYINYETKNWLKSLQDKQYILDILQK